MWRLLLCVALVSAQQYFKNTHRFDGYQVWSVTPQSEDDVQLIQKLNDDEELYFVTVSGLPGVESLIQIPPHKLALMTSFFKQHDIEVTVEIMDVQRDIEALQSRLLVRYEQSGGKFNYDKDDFNTLDAIMGELDNMVAACPEGFNCETYSVGDSYEGREIIMLHVWKDEPGRRAYWFDSTIHSGEWLATTTLLRIMDNMIYNYATDEDAARLLDGYDFYFMPVMNPDGYEFTWTDTRTWRKSRNINEGSACIGTDLNRNHDFMWGNVGTSANPCSGNYRGAAPADQPEIQVVEAEMNRLAPDLLSMTSIHTQGQMWLTPWGYHDEQGQCTVPDDYDEIMVVANAVADATQAVHNTVWTRGSICTTIYPAAGTTCDYAKGVPGIKYSFTPELRGLGADPQSQIVPSYEEVWAGVLAMVDTIADQEGL